MTWLTISLLWYFKLVVMGIVFLPMSIAFFGDRFVDKGYAFGKILGILLCSLALFVLGVLHLAPFTEISAFTVFGGFAVLNMIIARKKIPKGTITARDIRIWFFLEILFLCSLLFWVVVRGQEPSIRGLEKYMDFGFINAILRSSYFPPNDIWLAGHALNYYYFGHLTAATVTLLFQVKSDVAYNLILATLFALGMTQTWSLVATLLSSMTGRVKAYIGALVGAYLLNLGGNLHTIYLFTKGYGTDTPIPFWNILSVFSPATYWYPNATRFIPFTIHEFPSYSYVVADLHGHVFDIPLVLFTVACMLRILKTIPKKQNTAFEKEKALVPMLKSFFSQHHIWSSLLLGAMVGIHYMTNAFDGIVYGALGIVFLFFIVSSWQLRIQSWSLFAFAALISSLPFSIFFEPFASGIGVNCAPSWLTSLAKVGPFLFEKGNCQISEWWMLLVLWGFFLWFGVVFFLIHRKSIKTFLTTSFLGKFAEKQRVIWFVALFFIFGHMLLIIPEFVYLKDIYPAHFRANTMFKLGYQAYLLMSIASMVSLFSITAIRSRLLRIGTGLCAIVLVFFVAVYPYFAITSYYGTLAKEPVLDGSIWMQNTFPEYREAIQYLRANAQESSVLLEAQGDSYTDFDIVSAYTGIPTVAGWWVHEWLWRGNAQVVGDLIPLIEDFYKGTDMQAKKAFIERFNLEYIVVGPNEEQKYNPVQESSINTLGKKVFSSSNGRVRIYRIYSR